MPRLRLVHVNGPLQAMTATAAVLHLQGREPLETVLMFGTRYGSAHASLRRAAVDCARAAKPVEVIDVGTRADLGRLDRLPGADVAEILVMNNYALHGEIIQRFPEATVTLYGDSLGSVGRRRGPGAPRVDRVVTPLPQPTERGVLDDVPSETVPRERFLEAMAAARRTRPALQDADAELAEFTRDGVLAVTGALSSMDYGTTPRGETRLIVELVRRSAPHDRSPVLIKPHPRATLGVAAAAARELRREGHPVRLWSDTLYGGYPIELFEQTMHAVARIRSVASSATVSIAYVHGILSDVDLDPGLARRTIGPLWCRRFVGLSSYYDDLQRHLAHVGGNGLPPWPDLDSPWWQRPALKLASPFLWTQVSSQLPPRARPWPEPVTAGPRVDDRAAGLRWEADALLEHAVVREGDAAARIDRTAEALAEHGGRFAVTVAVLPPTHLPPIRQAWQRRRGASVGAGASLRSPQVEDLLERWVDITDARAVAPGFVRFECRSRSARSAIAPPRALTA